jgi:hypothetical protein
VEDRVVGNTLLREEAEGRTAEVHPGRVENERDGRKCRIRKSSGSKKWANWRME